VIEFGSMRSMTGFGSGRASDGERVFVVEVRSVNHRYCDVRVHVPHDLAGLESRLESRVRKRVERGRLDVSIEVSYVSEAVALPEVDVVRARGYRDALVLLAKELELEPKISLQMIADLPGVIRTPESNADLERIGVTLDGAIDAAVTELIHMREREGRALDEELRARLGSVNILIDSIRVEVPKSNAERKSRLEQRLTELIAGRTLDSSRIEQEVAVLVDRADVTEELMRLSSHVAQLETLLKATEPVGRKLDFMLQEMHREANTIGSKTMNARISHLVVDLKAELERMREQIQNVE
jgi:uncharacterized protein (TIGR00255 family)